MSPKILAAAVTALAFALPAAAQGATPRVDQREANQERRIEQGVHSGELTPREAARLERGQRRVERLEARAKADGVVTRRERQALHHAQDDQGRRIYRQKHDAQARVPAAFSPG